MEIHEKVEATVKRVFENAKWTKKSKKVKGAASATGVRGAACATGIEGRAKGADGNALFLCERTETGEIIAVWAGIVGQDGIEPDTFYTLRDGKPEVWEG